MNTFKTFLKRREEARERRVSRVRKKILGTRARPRLAIFRSNKHLAAQIIDDTDGKTLAAVSSQQKWFREQFKHGGDKKAAEVLGQKIAELAKQKGVTQVVFDKRWYRYHGRVKFFAEAARKGGLDF